MGRSIRRLLPAVLAILLAGCAAGPEFIARPYVPPGRIAVLPFENESGSLEAPEMLRRLAWEALRHGGYDLLSPGPVEEKLRSVGITQGGQLETKSPEELARLLDASALFFGTLTEFSYVTLGFYHRRKVALSARLVSYDGALIWRNSAKAKNSNMSVKRVRRNLAEQIAVRTLESIFSHPLYPEMLSATRRLFMTLPSASDPHMPTGRGFPGQ